MKVSDAWALLGLEPTEDVREIKRAYGGLLKQIDVDADPAAFISLREARDLALSWGTLTPYWELEFDLSYESIDHDHAVELTPSLEDEAESAFDACQTPSWRPELPPGDCQRMSELRRQLDDLLFGDETSEPQRVATVGRDLIHACASASIDEATATERWLREALAAGIPRSDPLIEQAIRQFRWDSDLRPADPSFEYDLVSLQQRLSDLKAMKEMSAPDHRHRALEELRRPGRTRLGLFELSLAADVRDFLDKTLSTHPTLEHDLDAEAVAWWRAYFRRRHLPSQFWLQIGSFPVMLTFAGAVLVEGLDLSVPLSIVTGYLAALAMTAIGILGLAELRMWRSVREDEWRDIGFQSRKAEPWLAASLVLPVVTAIFAFNIWAAVLCNVVALVVAIGGYLNTRQPSRPVPSESYFVPGFPAMMSISAVIVIMVMPTRTAAYEIAPLATLCFLGFRGHDAAAISLSSLQVQVVRALRTVVAAVLATALVLLFVFAPAYPPPAVLILVPAAVGLQHFATANTYLATNGLEWLARVVGIVFYIAAPQQWFGDRTMRLIMALLIYVLVYALARTVLAFNRPSQQLEPLGEV